MSSSNPDLNSVERANQVPQTWDEHPENPYNWPEKKKWIIFSAAQFAVVLGGLNATGIATPSADIADAFHVDYSTFPNDYWPICAWTVGAGFGPLVGIPLLENFGVRIGYLVFEPAKNTQKLASDSGFDRPITLFSSSSSSLKQLRGTLPRCL